MPISFNNVNDDKIYHEMIELCDFFIANKNIIEI